ncbi:MAG: DUF4347 domain-containing protein, partial [Candidatus Thiodiazotropha sp. (ex Rostrolucina anterorostrata)]|nr:DUF4347 domain-containing protein [Candidatus Thiodiazotropha sp. (ex Rostrolucina anterorostrata)]
MNRSKKRNPLIFEELEPRLLLSADLVGIAIDLTPNDADHQPDESDFQVIEQALQSEQALVEVTDPDVTSQELVIIDQTTPEYQSLVDDLISQSGDGRSFEIVLLDTDSNGIEQISETLSQYTGLDAVHLISHGSQGEIQLGSTTIDLDEVQHNGKAISAWGNAFSAEGDLLIYGCDLAATIEGERLVDSLAQLTGADVAASDDLTGHNTLGGDWDLEYQSGAIEVTTFANEFTQQSWQGLLSLIPTGSETLVNQTTTGDQITHYDSGNQVASDAAGNFVVVWADGNSGDVYGRLYDAAGTAQGNEFRVNTYTTNTQFEAAVAMDDGGNFMVTWNSTNQDGSGYGVYAQRFDASGTTQGSEFLVNQTTTNNQGGASVAADGSGNFIVTWSSYTTANNSFDVYARQYNAAGNPLGGEFLVNTTTSDHQQHSAVAADDSGNFVVVWESYSQDGSGWGTYAQRFDAAGVAQGSEFIINTTTANEQRTPEIAMAGNGEFVVAWESHSQDGSGWGIYARRFDAVGNAQSGEIQVNTTTADEQDLPGVAMDDSGNFIVTWESRDQDATGTYGVYARQFDSAGAALSGEVQISTTYAGAQYYPSVTWSNNQAVFVWSGSGSGDSTGMFFRLAEATPHDNEAPSFGIGDGTVTTDIDAGSDAGQSVIVQSDGKILVAGHSDNGTSTQFTLTRYNVDGSLDDSFDGDGIVTTDINVINSDVGTSVALQADGKILVAGYNVNNTFSNFEFALIRYNQDGSLDASFDGDSGSGNGIVTTRISAGADLGSSVTVQADGNILVAGRSDNRFALVRYDNDGSLDTTFDTDGIVITDISANYDVGRSVTVQADDKILVAGYSYSSTTSSSEFMLVRYNADGSLDTTFDGDSGSGNGIVTTDIGTSSNDAGHSVTLQPDGKVTTDITTSSDAGFSVTVQADGKILVAGSSDQDFALVRYHVDGSLDTTFDGDGKVTTDLGSSIDSGWSVTVQPDGKILVSGKSNDDFALFRYNSDGSLDTRFDLTSTLDGTPSFTEDGAAVVLDADVQIFDAELSAIDDFEGATLTLVRNGGANAEDSFSPTGTITALNEGFNLEVDGVVIGSITTNSGGTLEILFSNAGPATNALVNSFMQQIGYSNSSDAPPASVQIDWVFDDGNTDSQGEGGALTATGSTTVSITAGNDAPTIATNTGATVSEGGSVTITSAMLNEGDPDDSGTGLTYSVTSVIAHGHLELTNYQAGVPILSFTQDDIDNNRVRYIHDGGETTSDSFDFSLADGGEDGATPATGTFNITVTAVNDAPGFTPLPTIFSDNTITGPGITILDMTTADIDGDGDMDIISVSNSTDAVAWHENDGSQGFTTHNITTAADGVISVTVADLDGDGDLDILSASQDDHKIAWYENDGSENFTAHTITTAATGASSVAVADMDGDGDLDVLSTSESGNSIDWYRNDGSENFTAVNIASANSPNSVTIADLDGDGDQDVLVAAYLDDTVVWYQNDGSGNFTTHTITTTADGAHSVTVADLDGDGDLDVLSASEYDDTVAWYENDGSANFTAHTITTTADGANSVAVADLDGDGDPDVLSASIWDKTVAWYQNDGSQNFTKYIIKTDPVEFTYFVTAADLDLDGDTDVLSSSLTGSDITWHENTSSGTTLDGTPSFTEGGAAVVLDSDVSVFDIDLDALNGGDGNYAGATLTLLRNGGANAEDSYSATGTLSALTEGGNLTVGATTIGTVTTNSNGTLLLTFNSSATNARVNQAMQQIAYANSSGAPPVSVQIDWTCDDGNNGSQGAGGALNVVGSTTVTIVAVDDVPVANTDSISIAEGGTATTLVGGAADVLSNDTGLGDTPVTVSLVTGPTQSAGFTLNTDG